MPSRMPNWNSRANALADGSPIDQRLQDAERRVRLHDPHKAQHGLRAHEAVGVERDGEFVIGAPALAEVADVAGLEARY